MGDVVYDFEEVLLNEQDCGQLLSEPFPLFDIDFNAPTLPSWTDPMAAPTSERIAARVTADGIFNALVTWYELDMGDEAGTLSFAPDMADPKHMYFRKVKQRLFFVSYEQRVEPADLITVELIKSGATYHVSAPADASAVANQSLVRWPTANALSYHFPMIAEMPRNIRFERALLRAIRHYTQRHGRGPHVLDIGSGTGLLAMMAARGGARKVTSVEMVPAVCAVAAQIVERNGYGDVVDVINTRSDELTLYAMGGERADICVSELIDDHVIGDGCLASMADARNRLLTPDCYIVPRGSRMFIQPISLRAKGPAGIALDEMNVFLTDQVVVTYPYHSGKPQRLAPSEYDLLGPALEVFDFDWAHEENVGELNEGRTSPPLPLRFSRGGVCNALMILFTLQMDAHDGMEKASGEAYDPSVDNDYSSGLDNIYTHWDNPMRFLPVELAVKQGDVLQCVATHNAHDLDNISLYGVTEAMTASPGGIGNHNLIDEPKVEKLGVFLSRGKLVSK